MDLQQLHERTGIRKRKLRYGLDHNLVPGLDIKIAAGEVGRPRRFGDDVGFGIVCAAKLLELGLPHEVIRRFMAGLLQIQIGGRGPEKPALAAIIEHSHPAQAFLGDCLNIRLVVADYDFGWFAPGNPAKLAAGYQPLVEVMLDLGQILDIVRGAERG